MSTTKAGDEGGPSQPKDAKEKALLCARWALEKKAYGIAILNVGVLTPIAEYFLICTGRSVRQTQAIVEHIRTRLKQEWIDARLRDFSVPLIPIKIAFVNRSGRNQNRPENDRESDDDPQTQRGRGFPAANCEKTE